MSRYKLPPLQEPSEFDAFIKILKEEKCRSYLEIGSMYGASLWKVTNELPKGSRIVSVDPMYDRPSARESLEQCIDELIRLGYDAHFIFGDSADKDIVALVRTYAPFDALFIDGNHTPEYVMSDWQNYGPMARIVGFHDINWDHTWRSARNNTPPSDGSTMGAPKIWEQVRNGHRFKEFKFYPRNNYYGIGVLWN
jgi:cephalosporin hydroxylase